MTATSVLGLPAFSRSDYKTLGLAAWAEPWKSTTSLSSCFRADLSQLFFRPKCPVAAPAAKLWHLRHRVPGAAAGRHPDGALRRPSGAQARVQPEHPDDGIACLLIGIMPAYAQIGYFTADPAGTARARRSGGRQVPSAWTFVAEHAPRHHRGYALGFLQAGLTFGYLLGALTATLLAQVLRRNMKSSTTPGVSPSCSAAYSA